MSGIVSYSAQAMCFEVDTVRVSFQKDTIHILEGESQIVVIELNGIISKNDTIDVKWTIKDSDATVDKDFKILSDDKFSFLSTKSTIQKRYFEISILKDNNIENEQILLELRIIKGGKVAKIEKQTCLIILKDVKSETEILKEEFAAEKKQLLDKISDIVNKDKDTSEVIGRISLKEQPITLYKWWSPNKDKNTGYKDSLAKSKIDSIGVANISKVEIQFKYGVAAEIRAFTKDSSEVFSNHWYNGKDLNRPRYGVSYRHNSISERNKGYYLIGENNSNRLIRLFDLLDYKHNTGLNFVPSDTLVRLFYEKDKKEAKILVKTSLNSYINFNIYTDLLGLLKIDQSNGIIQSDASAKIYLTTLPARNKLRFHFNYLMPYAKLARFENGFQNVPTTENKSFRNIRGQSDTLSRMLLNQRKFFDIGLKLNILNKIGKFDNIYELNAFTGFGWFNRQGPIDSVQTEKIGTTQYQGFLSNTFEFGFEARAAVLQYRNFGINTGIMATFQRIINANLTGVADGGFKPFYRTEAEIFFYPIAKSKDKIFLRTYHTFNSNENEESFLRIQVGYKAQFNISNKK